MRMYDDLKEIDPPLEEKSAPSQKVMADDDELLNAMIMPPE